MTTANYDEHVLTGEVNLFLFVKEISIYLSYTQIQKIWWKADNCYLTLAIRGVSDISTIDKLDSGFDLGIYETKYGRRDNIDNGEELFTIRNCKICKKWICKVNAMTSDEAQRCLTMYVKIIGVLDASWKQRGA